MGFFTFFIQQASSTAFSSIKIIDLIISCGACGIVFLGSGYLYHPRNPVCFLPLDYPRYACFSTPLRRARYREISISKNYRFASDYHIDFFHRGETLYIAVDFTPSRSIWVVTQCYDMLFCELVRPVNADALPGDRVLTLTLIIDIIFILFCLPVRRGQNNNGNSHPNYRIKLLIYSGHR